MDGGGVPQNARRAGWVLGPPRFRRAIGEQVREGGNYCKLLKGSKIRPVLACLRAGSAWGRYLPTFLGHKVRACSRLMSSDRVLTSLSAWACCDHPVSQATFVHKARFSPLRDHPVRRPCVRHAVAPSPSLYDTLQQAKSRAIVPRTKDQKHTQQS